MLTEVEVINPGGEILKLPLQDVSAGIIVKEINGLSPVKTAIASTVFANQDGEQYQSSRRGMRNITMKLGLEPHYGGGSVQAIRRRLYNFLMPKAAITLRFKTGDSFDYVISGRVEAFESPLFAKEPEADISILCFNPDFKSSVEKQAFGYGQTSYGYDYPGALALYEGTTPTGFRLVIQATASFPESFQNFTFSQQRSYGEDKMEFALPEPVPYGGIVEIVTINGQKSATTTINGVKKSVLSGMTVNSKWLQLYPNDNKFLLIDDMDVGSARWDLYYFDTYGGL